MKFIPIFIFFLNFALAQNIPLYLTLVEKGEIQEVRESLPNLLSRYPNDPGVYYLEALISNSYPLYSTSLPIDNIISLLSNLSKQSESSIDDFLFITSFIPNGITLILSENLLSGFE